MDNASSLNRKEMIKEGILKYQERSNNTEIHTHTHTHTRLPSPLEFLNYVWWWKQNLLPISDMVLNVCRVKIEDNFIINEGVQRDIKILYFTQSGKWQHK